MIMKTKNTFAMLLFVTGVAVLVLGIIGSIVLGRLYATVYTTFNGTIFFIGLVSTLITSFLIVGLAELIRLTDENREYLRRIVDNGSASSGTNSYNAKSISSQLPEI